jgi:3-dehydroquinate synthase class II
LSVYFIGDGKIAFDTLNSYLKEVEFTEDNLILIKDTLKEISKTTNNRQELETIAINNLVDNVEAKKELIDIIFFAQKLDSMSIKNLKEYLEENISVIQEHPDIYRNKQLKANIKKRQTMKLLHYKYNTNCANN